MLMMTGRGVAVIVVVVRVMIRVNLVNQSQVLQMHVGGCRQPTGHQQQRHHAPNPSHGGNMWGHAHSINASEFKGPSTLYRPGGERGTAFGRTGFLQRQGEGYITCSPAWGFGGHGYLQQRTEVSIGFVQPCVTVWVLDLPKPVTPRLVEHPPHPCVETRVVGFPRTRRTSPPLAVSEARAVVTVVHDPQFECVLDAGRETDASRTGDGAPNCVRRSAPFLGASAAPLVKLIPKVNPRATLTDATRKAMGRRVKGAFMLGLLVLIFAGSELSTHIYVGRGRNPPDIDRPFLSSMHHFLA